MVLPYLKSQLSPSHTKARISQNFCVEESKESAKISWIYKNLEVLLRCAFAQNSSTRRKMRLETWEGFYFAEEIQLFPNRQKVTLREVPTSSPREPSSTEANRKLSQHKSTDNRQQLPYKIKIVSTHSHGNRTTYEYIQDWCASRGCWRTCRTS